MFCCGLEAEFKENWFSHCLNCKKVFLQPIERHLKYIKILCPKSTSNNFRKNDTYPYYKIDKDEQYISCKCCCREFVIDQVEKDEMNNEIHLATGVLTRFNSLEAEKEKLLKKIRNINALEYLTIKKKSLESRINGNSTFFNNMKSQHDVLKPKANLSEKTKKIYEENIEMKNKIEILRKLKKVRQIVPEMTLEIMEIARLKDKIGRMRFCLDAEKDRHICYQQIEDEYMRLSGDKAEKEKLFGELADQHFYNLTTFEDYEKLEAKRSQKLLEAEDKHNQNIQELAKKKKQINVQLDLTSIMALNLFDEIKDFRETQERQRHLPLYQLLPEETKSLDIESVLENLTRKAEDLYDKDHQRRLFKLIKSKEEEEERMMEGSEESSTQKSILDEFIYSVPELSFSSTETKESEAFLSEKEKERCFGEEISTSSCGDSFEVINEDDDA